MSISILLLSLALQDPVAPADEARTVHWPSFRGPSASGLALGFETVEGFDVEKGENVLWRVEVPGLAHSSPVIWGERIYLTTAVKEGEDPELKVGLYGSVESVEDDLVHEMRVLCLDKADGRVLWDRLAWKGVPAIKRHPKGSHAASTPATDGEHVLAFFGSEGLYCYDRAGELLWKKDFGTLDAGWYVAPGCQWGFGSSPVIHGERVIVQCDVQENSFLAALDLKTGEELWRTPRDEVPTWSTPTVDVREGRSQVLCNGYKHIGGYDLETGKPLWWLEGGGDIPVPTPIVGNDLVYVTNAHGMAAPILAIEATAEGQLELPCDSVPWYHVRRGNYMQTPLLVGELLFLCADHGVLACYDALTGELFFRERVGAGKTGFTPSIVAADGKLYVTGEDGEVFVARIGKEFEIAGPFYLGEECMATPAISAGVVYWRTCGHLIAVGTGE